VVNHVEKKYVNEGAVSAHLSLKDTVKLIQISFPLSH